MAYKYRTRPRDFRGLAKVRPTGRTNGTKKKGGQ